MRCHFRDEVVKKKNGFCLRLPSWIACSRKAICFPVSSTMEKPVGQRTEVSKPQAHGRACKQILHPHLRLSWMQTQQTPRLKFCEAPWTRTTSVSHSQIPYPQKSWAIHFFMLLHLLIYMQQITYRGEWQQWVYKAAQRCVTRYCLFCHLTERPKRTEK